MAALEDLIRELMKHPDFDPQRVKEAMDAELLGREKSKPTGLIYDGDRVLSCTYCGSASMVKAGHDAKGVQKYRCKDCGKYFRWTTGTVFSHSKIGDWQWKEIIKGMIQGLTLSQIADATELAPKTVMLNRYKILLMLFDMFNDQDTFVDIAECDEYFVHMSFKGKQDPRFFIYVLRRMPRHHRSYGEKVEYLKEAGLWEELQAQPKFLGELLGGDSYLQGTNRDSVCILTGKDRSGNLFVKPVCLGSMEAEHVMQHFDDRFEVDAIMVTDSTNVYNQFAEDNNLHHEKVLSSAHTSGAFHMGHINAFHSFLSSYWADHKENLPATKYLMLNLMLVWWLEKNKDMTLQQKVDEIYGYMKDYRDHTITYEELKKLPLTLDTKGLIPDVV